MVRYSYWNDHTYHRRSIEKSFDGFCGWNTLENLVEPLDLENKGLVSTLFETGGRATECLALKKDNFEIQDRVVLVKRMPVLKQRQRVVFKDEDGNEWYYMGEEKPIKYSVKKLDDRTFPISLNDPLASVLLEFIGTKKEGELLFPFGYSKLYMRIRDLEKNAGEKHGEWYPHRFRGERASQLASEKNFDVLTLMEYFGWKRHEIPSFYVKLSAKQLIQKILVGEV